MRKTIGILLICMFLLGISSKVLALTNYDRDTGYVIVRCTVTVDVDVLDEQATAWFVQRSTAGALSVDQADVSISSISVKNNSTGAVLKYAVLVSSIQRTHDGSNWISDDDDFNNLIKGWTLSNNNTNDGVGEFVLSAVFARSRPAISDFNTVQANDQFRVNLGSSNPSDGQLQAYTYKTNGDNFDPNNGTLRYTSVLGNSSGINAVSPGEVRGLWFYIRTPQAVTDTYPRRITNCCIWWFGFKLVM